MLQDTTILIGPYEVPLVFVDYCDVKGYFQRNEGMKIVVLREPSDPMSQRDTVLHELMHLVYFCYGIEESDNEERTVTTLAHGLTEVFARNPDIARYLAGVRQRAKD